MWKSYDENRKPEVGDWFRPTGLTSATPCKMVRLLPGTMSLFEYFVCDAKECTEKDPKHTVHTHDPLIEELAKRDIARSPHPSWILLDLVVKGTGMHGFLNVRDAPRGKYLTRVPEGEHVQSREYVVVDGERWEHIISPYEGWACAKYLFPPEDFRHREMKSRDEKMAYYCAGLNHSRELEHIHHENCVMRAAIGTKIYAKVIRREFDDEGVNQALRSYLGPTRTRKILK